MCFEIGRVDHYRLRNCRLRGQPFHHPREDAHVAPPLPSVVEGLCRAVFLRRVGPPQAIAIDEYYSTQNAPVIHARLAMTLWKERPKPRHLFVRQPVKIAHNAPRIWEFESCKLDSLKRINGSGA